MDAYERVNNTVYFRWFSARMVLAHLGWPGSSADRRRADPARRVRASARQ
jgi:hypothetical protein